MQANRQFQPVPGIVYHTTMSRPDAALALALLHGVEGKREARIGGVAIVGAGLDSAVFCDIVGRFYAGSGPPSNSNRVLPVGLALSEPLPPDSPMVKAPVSRRNEMGQPVYPRTLERMADTSEVAAMTRNAITAQSDAMTFVVLSAPATYLLKTLNLAGVRDLIAAKVKALVIADAGQDAAALRTVLANWPTEVVLCGREVGEALPYPAESVEKDFNWASMHPIEDAYRAYRPMPYDAPSWDLAAALYAARAEAGLFQASEPGTIQVADSGAISFQAGAGGRHRKLSVDPANKEKILQICRDLVTAKPAPRPTRRPPTAAK